jgi:nicotinic acid mononucleotide adenylyltransferase
MNIVIIFQNALMDKMYDNQNYDKMEFSDRLNMAEKIVEDLESIYVKEIEIDINKYPIFNTFLFKFFMENFSFEFDSPQKK